MRRSPPYYRRKVRAALLMFAFECADLDARGAGAGRSKADAPKKQPAPGKEELSPAPAKVDVKPVARDEEIRKRLQSVLDATGWFTDPQVRVEEGVVFLNGPVGDRRTQEMGRRPGAQHPGCRRRGQPDGGARAVGLGFQSGVERAVGPVARLHPLASLFRFRAAHPGTVGGGRRGGDARSAGVPSPTGPSEPPAKCDRSRGGRARLPLRRPTSFCESPA